MARARARFPWRWRRALVQLGALAVFLWLARPAAPHAPAEAGWAFRLDPLAPLSALLGWTWSWWLLPAVAVLALALLAGRWFCGWLCPLGTCLDGCAAAGAPLRRRLPPAGAAIARVRWLRGSLFAALLAAALLGLPLLGVLDPLALVARALNSLDPWLRAGADHGSLWVADQVPAAAGASEPLYRWLSDHVLIQRDAVPALALLSLALFAGALLAELVARRAWCRLLCPLGALLGLAARRAPVRRTPDTTCGSCTLCATACPAGALTAGGKLDPAACIQCQGCQDACPRGLPRPARAAGPPAGEPEVSRRGFLAACAGGSAAALAAGGGEPPEDCLRPPGVADEGAFRRACVRCGLCIGACPTGGLQPLALEAGAGALFTPALVPRRGGCEENCTRCGEVCPTGAIPRLSAGQKPAHPLGLAVVDRERCIPFAQKESCLVCEEFCPVPEKAIRIVGRHGPGKPRVIADRCTGCGLCEQHCPVEGVSAIRVLRRGHASAGDD
ncbi:MAG: 4Fe-4S binding protein [Planctomycetes bacterium]|nr:4Fe-4S binding protein [Planctomycetota bacterium]